VVHLLDAFKMKENENNEIAFYARLFVYEILIRYITQSFNKYNKTPNYDIAQTEFIFVVGMERNYEMQ
jgi:hypothetical protein